MKPRWKIRRGEHPVVTWVLDGWTPSLTMPVWLVYRDDNPEPVTWYSVWENALLYVDVMAAIA